MPDAPQARETKQRGRDYLRRRVDSSCWSGRRLCPSTAREAGLRAPRSCLVGTTPLSSEARVRRPKAPPTGPTSYSRESARTSPGCSQIGPISARHTHPPLSGSPSRLTRTDSIFGAVGKHGSIAVTERLIWSLKHEWLCRVPVIKGLDHVGMVLGEFEQYYNGWRAHSTVGGAVPDLVHAGTEWQAPERTAKHVPSNIERRFFSTARITAFRLADAA